MPFRCGKCAGLVLVVIGSLTYFAMNVFIDDQGSASHELGRCRREHWSCESADGTTCSDGDFSDCAGATWLGFDLPSNWSPHVRFGNCFVRGSELKCLPRLINLAPPKSGTTEIYSQLLGFENVISSTTNFSARLCAGRPLTWCEKEPNFWMHSASSSSQLLDYMAMYQPLSEKLKRAPTDEGDVDVISVDWSPLNYEANPFILRHVHRTAHFVVFLRNPIDRAESDYNWSFFSVAPSCFPRKRGAARIAERFGASGMHMLQLFRTSVRNFKACLEKEGSGAASQKICWHRSAENRTVSCSNFRTSSAYVLRGLYSVYLRLFLDAFPVEHFLVAPLGNDAPERLQPWLGGTWRAPATTGPKLGKSQHQVRMISETAEMLREFYSPYVKDLQELFHDPTLSWW